MQKLLLMVLFAACMSTTAFAADKRSYVFAAGVLGHPYWNAAYQGFDYAAQKFGVDIKRVGPQDWNPPAQAEAVEQSIAKKPDGIIAVLWDGSSIPPIKKAMAAGIPVVVVEANLPDSGAMAFIGLDNYQAGADTAKELIKLGGESGKVVALGNWGASNTDAKYRGFSDYLAAHSKWTILGKVDDKGTTNPAIEAAKSLLNTYNDATGIVGLDSSAGTGLGLAAEELRMDISKLTIVVNDREDAVLDYIHKGVIGASILNKTALEAYMAIELLEAYNDSKIGLADVPISTNNKSAGVTPMPENVFMGTVVVDKNNVEYFLHKK
jgi:ABC-type sugar transport system substrate-binding protein